MAAEPPQLPCKPAFTYRGDVVALLRAYAVGAQRYADDYAVRHEMHPTDMQAMAVLHQAQQEGISLCAGELGRALSLSSPATSALLYRLESQGHITRSHDSIDRRKVLIVLDPKPLAEIMGFFQPLGACVAGALEGCTDAEVLAIVGFLTRVVGSTNELVGEGHVAAAPTRGRRADHAAI
jgi:DNA-binding MarR family transcriptional regulator